MEESFLLRSNTRVTYPFRNNNITDDKRRSTHTSGLEATVSNEDIVPLLVEKVRNVFTCCDGHDSVLCNILENLQHPHRYEHKSDIYKLLDQIQIIEQIISSMTNYIAGLNYYKTEMMQLKVDINNKLKDARYLQDNDDSDIDSDYVDERLEDDISSTGLGTKAL